MLILISKRFGCEVAKRIFYSPLPSGRTFSLSLFHLNSPQRYTQYFIWITKYKKRLKKVRPPEQFLCLNDHTFISIYGAVYMKPPI